MSETLRKVQELARRKLLRISGHGYDELAADGLLAGEVIDGLEAAVVVEDYPAYPKGPCVLVLQKDAAGRAVHALWGIAAGKSEPAVLITAYRPDPAKWEPDYLRRRGQP